jgi:hypothetical protein
MTPRALLLAAALVVAAASSPASDGPAAEYEVKAAFLYNFAKFIRWPEGKANPEAPIRICILGSDPFGDALDRTVAGKMVRERTLEVRRFTRARGIEECHIVFISPSEEDRLPDILADVDDEAVLTVGESERFAERGGIVSFRMRENRIRLDINIDAAERAGLRMSSQLLKLARIVHDLEGSE